MVVGLYLLVGLIMLLVEMLYQKFTMIVPYMYAYMVTQCVYFIPYTHMVWYAASVNAVGEMLRHCIFTISDNICSKVTYRMLSSNNKAILSLMQS